MFSETEQKIVNLLHQGKSNKEIGYEINVCDKTVKFHLTSIFKKAGIEGKGRGKRLKFIAMRIGVQSNVTEKVSPKAAEAFSKHQDAVVDAVNSTSDITPCDLPTGQVKASDIE